jgi:monofunctional biosynthetic peptidoglycan transglycosylase
MATRMARRAPPPRTWKTLLFGAAIAVAGWAAYEWYHLPDARALIARNPPTTALIEERAREARAHGLKPRRHQVWVPLSGISQNLVDAVLASEDADFYHHHGVDPHALELAAREAWRKRALGRGASTITQQLAKNLWLSGDRSLIRKLKELILATRLERDLGKQRILTLYLNVAEWGDGVYGAEAGAEESFSTSAGSLDLSQAALLAAMLPAPRKRGVQSHSAALRRRALWIVDEVGVARKSSAEEIAANRQGVDALLGGGPSKLREDEEEEESPEGE